MSEITEEKYVPRRFARVDGLMSSSSARLRGVGAWSSSDGVEASDGPDSDFFSLGVGSWLFRVALEDRLVPTIGVSGVCVVSRKVLACGSSLAVGDRNLSWWRSGTVDWT